MNIIFYPYKICPECYSDKLITDIDRQETYCSSCGLIVQDNTFMTLQQKKHEYLRELKNKELEKKFKIKVQQELQNAKNIINDGGT